MSTCCRWVIVCILGFLSLPTIINGQSATTINADNKPESEVAKRILLMQNGNDLLKPNAWRPMVKDGCRREGNQWICDNGSNIKAQNGVVQTVVLQQKRPTPIVAIACSRAEGVTGSSDADYGVYLDLTYADGTHLWGQTAAFKTGTHDWQERRVVILPDKPVKTLNFYLLLRNHGGKAWFRSPELRMANASASAYTFDGLAIEPVGNVREGFQIRDAATGGNFLRPSEMSLPSDPSEINTSVRSQAKALGLNLTWQKSTVGGATFFDVTLSSDTPTKDRAITLVYAVPMTGKNMQWLCDPRRPTPVEPGREYAFTTGIHAGNGRLSRYPFAAVADGVHGAAIGIDMAQPAVFRTAYHSGTGELFVAYDIGLTREKPTAKIRFCRFAFDPAWGFRSALARYYDFFPEHFRCRATQQGLWMPFAAISKVKGWQDFGFKFKEGNDETKWDDEHGIATFRYTEPMTWWMAMPKDTPRTLDAALAEAKRLAEKGNVDAKSLLSSGMHDSAGHFAARLLDTPWCNGAVWSMNSMPGIEGETSHFKTKWTDAIREKLYGPKRNGDLDGEYIDSAEGYVTEELDFRRDHFAAADTPLTFSTEDCRPVVFRGLVAFEYIRGIAADVHGMGKLMMANGVPGNLCWLAPLVDVTGTETNWNPEGRWHPMSDSELFFRRVLCKGKPYCFLMNTQFDRFSPELVEKYMKRSLAYGMFPGFFSADASTGQYFAQPKLYERDRPLFKKYVSLCKLVAEAGWNPITAARSSDDRVYVERFGRYLTVFNDSPERRTATITLDGKAPASSRELLDGSNVSWTDGHAAITLDGESVAVLELP